MNFMQVRRFWMAGVVLAAARQQCCRRRQRPPLGCRRTRPPLSLPFSFSSPRSVISETATRVEGSQAETVTQELTTRFHSPFVDRVVLVVQGLPPADSQEGEQALSTIVAGLREEPGVSGVVSHIELRDPIFLGKGGGTFVLVGLSSSEEPVESLVPGSFTRAGANSLANQLREATTRL